MGCTGSLIGANRYITVLQWVVMSSNGLQWVCNGF